MYHHHNPSTILPNRHGFVKRNGRNAWPTPPMRLRKSSRKSTNTIGREQAIWWRLCWERSLRNRPWPNSRRDSTEKPRWRYEHHNHAPCRYACSAVWSCSSAPGTVRLGVASGASHRPQSNRPVYIRNWRRWDFAKGAVLPCNTRWRGSWPSVRRLRWRSKELARQGIRLDKKAVRRIAEQLGTQMLALRQRELLAWRAGQLPAGNEFAGRRVVVQIDGGRVRLRENRKRQQKQRRRKGQREKFHTPWREPKVLTIFEIDERGKMTKKHRQPLIDGTLLGPDHLAELVAYHLHRLGVAQAELVVFVSDGARWIWDRLDWIEQRAGLDPSRTVHVLDFCHAAHHVSLALQTLAWDETQRRETYGRLRKLLKGSRWEEVVDQLIGWARGQPENSDIWTEIRYLNSHGQEGHLNYVTFRRRGIPCGSGAIESAIRRVINQRLKSNAMYWLQENAEAMFAVRATLLCDRWEETLTRVRHSMARDRRLDWRWDAPNTSCRIERRHRRSATSLPTCYGTTIYGGCSMLCK